MTVSPTQLSVPGEQGIEFNNNKGRRKKGSGSRQYLSKEELKRLIGSRKKKLILREYKACKNIILGN
jgi:hypothetical protein